MFLHMRTHTQTLAWFKLSSHTCTWTLSHTLYQGMGTLILEWKQTGLWLSRTRVPYPFSVQTCHTQSVVWSLPQLLSSGYVMAKPTVYRTSCKDVYFFLVPVSFYLFKLFLIIVRNLFVDLEDYRLLFFLFSSLPSYVTMHTNCTIKVLFPWMVNGVYQSLSPFVKKKWINFRLWPKITL